MTKVTSTENLDEWFLRYVSGQLDRHTTDILITIIPWQCLGALIMTIAIALVCHVHLMNVY